MLVATPKQPVAAPMELVVQIASSATRRVVGPSAVVTVCPEDLLVCD